MHKRTGKVLAALAVGTAATILGPVGSVQAADTSLDAKGGNGCDGTLVDQFNHKNNNGTLIAITYLYWDGTYNCVASVKANHYYGVSTRMNLDIWSKRGGHGNDSGKFKYQAGPAKVNGKGTCIYLELDMWNADGANVLQDHIPPAGYFHCD